MSRIPILILVLCCSLFSLDAQSSDALNALDENGRRTGYWIINASMKPTQGFSPEQVIEEGNYAASKKQGLWKRYFPSGKVQSEITYTNNIPNGPYKTYYTSGLLEEQGSWNFNKNTGDFKRFHPNGKPSQEFTFSDNGLRNGEQRYYHENGVLELQVNVINGKENGRMTRYFANGEIKEVKDFNEGVMADGSIRTYQMRKPAVVLKETPAVPEKTSPVVKEDKPNIHVFKDTGKNTLYNKDLQVSQSGYFKNGRLWIGRWYRYDSNGILESIEVYKDGKLAGYAPIEEE